MSPLINNQFVRPGFPVVFRKRRCDMRTPSPGWRVIVEKNMIARRQPADKEPGHYAAKTSVNRIRLGMAFVRGGRNLYAAICTYICVYSSIILFYEIMLKKFHFVLVAYYTAPVLPGFPLVTGAIGVCI